MTRPGLTDAERFEGKLDKSSGCWLWMGGKNEHGYGRFTPRGAKTRIAHRYAYEMWVGPIPDGLHLDHLCRNRACVNPEHLEPVTIEENHARRPERTHCPSGHEFTPENTYLYQSGSARPYKHCRTCARERARARAEQRRAA